MWITFILLYLVAAKVLVLWTDCSSAYGNLTTPGGSGQDQPSTGSGTSENAPTDYAPEQSDAFMGLFNTNGTLPETVLMDKSGVKSRPPPDLYGLFLRPAVVYRKQQRKALAIGDAYGSHSINGFMTDYSYYTRRRTVHSYRNQTMGVFTGRHEDFLRFWYTGNEVRTWDQSGHMTIDEPTLALMLEKSDWEGPALKTPTNIAQH